MGQVDERRRAALFDAAVEAFGEEPAETMFAMLPPPDTQVATRADIDRLEARTTGIDGRLGGIDGRFDGRFDGIEGRLDRRFDGIEARFDGMDARFTAMEDRFTSIDGRFDDVDRRFVELREVLELRSNELDARLTARFEASLREAVTGQTRMLALALVGSLVGITGLAFAFSQLF